MSANNKKSPEDLIYLLDTALCSLYQAWGTTMFRE